jgi:hypothetical protein
MIEAGAEALAGKPRYLVEYNGGHDHWYGDCEQAKELFERMVDIRPFDAALDAGAELLAGAPRSTFEENVRLERWEGYRETAQEVFNAMLGAAPRVGLRQADLLTAHALADTILSGKVLPAEKQIEMITLIYNLLGEGWSETRIRQEVARRS